MNKNDFFYLGKILKTHGNNGYFLVFLDVEEPSRLLKVEAIFIGIGNDFIPFMIEDIDFTDHHKAILKFEDIDSVSQAEIYSGKSLFVPVSLAGIPGKEFLQPGITGFTVMDEKYGNIGILKSVIDLPGQKLLQVIFREREILIPMVGAILVKTDIKEKIIHVKVPEGLIEIYL